MRLGQIEIHEHDESKITVQLNSLSFEKLIYDLMAAYRQYCKHDIILMQKLVSMLKFLAKQPSILKQYHEEIKAQIAIVSEDIKANIDNQSDRERLQKILQE